MSKAERKAFEQSCHRAIKALQPAAKAQQAYDRRMGNGRILQTPVSSALFPKPKEWWG